MYQIDFFPSWAFFFVSRPGVFSRALARGAHRILPITQNIELSIYVWYDTSYKLPFFCAGYRIESLRNMFFSRRRGDYTGAYLYSSVVLILLAVSTSKARYIVSKDSTFVEISKYRTFLVVYNILSKIQVSSYRTFDISYIIEISRYRTFDISYIFEISKYRNLILIHHILSKHQNIERSIYHVIYLSV